jgi:hypothetical protein
MPRVYSSGPGASRLSPYDRNPLISGNYFNATQGPAALTPQWAYTVPAKRKAVVELLHSRMIRVTAASPAVKTFCFFAITPAGGAVQYVYTVNLLTIENTAGNSRELSGAPQFILGPGDKLEAYTWDAGTGGTIDFLLEAKWTEFDA